MNPNGRWRVPALAALALLEFAWLRHFLAQPLPNSAAAGGQPIARSLLLWRAFPEVVPGVTFNQSHLGMTLRELSHLGNLPQRLPIVLAAALIALAALSLGLWGMRAVGLSRRLDIHERLPLAYLVGAAALGVIALLLGRLGWLTPAVARFGLGALAISGVGAIRGGPPGPRAPAPLDGQGRAIVGLVGGPFLILMALAAMLPTIDFDAIEYHLAGPKEWYQAGRIAFLPHNVYTSMPFGVEMLHLLGMHVLGDWWWGGLVGQLLVASFAPVALAMVALSAGRWGSPRAAWVAAIVYLSTPWIYRLAAIPYVEGPLCAFQAGLIYAGGWAWNRADDRSGRVASWTLVGLLAGGAMACKYTAILSAVVPFAALAGVETIRRRDWRPAAGFALGWALIMTPWLAKNAVDTGNPVYPLAHRIFGGRHWDATLDARWAAAHGPKPIALIPLVDSVVDVAGRSDWQSPLYLALAPLALLRPGSRRAVGALLGLSAFIFATWWLATHRLDRFWLPILPPLAILAGLGADWMRGRTWSVQLGAILAVGVASGAVYDTTALVGLNEWTADLNELRTSVPSRVNAPLLRLDRELPPGAKPLLVGAAATFHMNRPVVYNTVFNPETLETLGPGPSKIARGLADLGVSHVYVDWAEVDRHRKPGGYGFTPFITRELVAELMAGGVLGPPQVLGPLQDLYEVRDR